MPLSDDHNCLRCGFSCSHVEAGGIEACPNCGPPHEDVLHPGEVYYHFGHGCRDCRLAGHPPLEGFMQPLPVTDLRVVYGLAPTVKRPCQGFFFRAPRFVGLA